MGVPPAFMLRVLYILYSNFIVNRSDKGKKPVVSFEVFNNNCTFASKYRNHKQINKIKQDEAKIT